MASLTFQNVTFAYDTIAQPIIDCLSLQFCTGWTGIVGPNGAGKTTILRLAAAQLEPQGGSIHRPRSMLYCPQRTDEPPASLSDFLAATDSVACGLRGRLGLQDDWLSRWATLSHGERKRAQIGVALWLRPGGLAIDEPTNHIDADARRLLAAELESCNCVGLLVSHDRKLLDRLCRQCLFLDPPFATLRPGGYSKGAGQAKADEAAARRLRRQASVEARRIRQEQSRRRQEASREHQVRSKRGLARGDSDGREKINRARVADGKAGAPMRQLRGRSAQAEQKLAAIQVKKEVKMGIWLPEARSRRNWLFRIAAGAVSLGAHATNAEDGTAKRQLVFPELAMGPDERVAITGPNGAGKSTLIRHILERVDLPEDKVLYMPQELDAVQARQIVNEVRSFGHADLGEMMSSISRLGSDPQRVLETEQPSPGETRKLLLAMGALRAAHLIIMDEPTNHLDLPSIECLEAAMAECPCGLLLVSHDLEFLTRLARIRWDIQPIDDRPSYSELTVRSIGQTELCGE